MQTSLSSLVDNLSEIYNKECKKCMERKKNLNYEFVEFKSVKNVKNHAKRY